MHIKPFFFFWLALLAGAASGLTLNTFHTRTKALKRTLLAKGGGVRGGGGIRGSSSTRGGSGMGRGGSGDTGFRAVGAPGINTNGRYANFFGGGGGKPFTLSSPSVFAGRSMGGGTRAQVPGTRTYGSGYPGGGGGRGDSFPFGFWPIYWMGHRDCEEYGGNSTIDAQRPGGPQVIMELAAKSGVWNLTSVNVTVNGTTTRTQESYWMIGDIESVTALASVLADSRTTEYGCGIDSRPILPFNSSNTANASLPYFENVIQWYRSSSFAIATTQYNNTYTFPPLNETVDFGWNASTPLPTFIQTQVDAYLSYTQTPTSFLACLNRTISAALPILDEPPPLLSVGGIIGVTIACCIGFLILCGCLHYLWCKIRDGIANGIEAHRRKRAEEKRQRDTWNRNLQNRDEYDYARVDSGHYHSSSISFVRPPSPYHIAYLEPVPSMETPYDRCISTPNPEFLVYSSHPFSYTNKRNPLDFSHILIPQAYLSTTVPSSGESRRRGYASRLSVASTTPSMKTACDEILSSSSTERKDQLAKKDDAFLSPPKEPLVLTQTPR
ncbi:SubName: Full=Uncharacterized protein {ECO:0000313/EMBL:CCA74669.1} [Serendipita indica DSM 11827]|nr:SubName: Full=Uncharacterized protein {ECO:0000313/EMBL:CCA74669.1} [Serendipita indica DSM 11827]